MRQLLLLILSFPLFVSAQQVLVTDNTSGKPIADVFFYCDKGSAISNAQGYATITGLRNCKTIGVQHPSYGYLNFTFEKLRALDFKIGLSENALSLEAVQLNFNKWEQNESEVPITITEIDQKEIARLNPQTTADLLQASGEVFVQKSQLGGGSPMIRGFATNRVLLVVDGVRMNTAIFREGNVQNVIALDANAIDRAEVIFGPGAVVYGSDALGGVMDFHTLTPNYGSDSEPLKKVNYLLRTNTANFEKTAHVDLSLGKKKWALLSSFTFSDYDNQTMGSNGPDDYLRPTYQTRIGGRDTVLSNPNPEEQIATGFSQFNSTQKLRYRVLPNLELTYGWHYSRSSDVPRYDRLIRPSSNGLRHAEWRYGPQLWQMHTINANYYQSNAFFDRAKVTLAYQQFEESRIDRDFGSDVRRIREERVDAYSASIDFEKMLSENTSLQYGIDAVFNQIGSLGVAENIVDGSRQAIASRYPDGSTWGYQATYLNLSTRLSSKWHLTAGVRGNLVQLRGTLNRAFFNFPFENINQNFNALNGSLGIVHTPWKNGQISLNLSNGFRAPNVDDAAKIFDSGDTVVVVPNATLNPEILYATDFGVIQRFGNLKLEASLYYSYLTKALVRRPFSFNGNDSVQYDGVLSQVQAVQNAEAAFVYGAQLGAKYTFLSYWNLNASYHWNTGETSDGEAMRHVSPNFGRMSLGYEKNKWAAGLVFMFNEAINFDNLAPSERDKTTIYALDENGNPFSPAWQTLDARVSYAFSNALKLQLRCENLFDVRYRPYSSGIAAPGRNFVFAIRGSI